MKQKRKGFTLVELIVVIAIVGILAAVLIPTFAGLIKKANENTDLQLVRNLNTAVMTEGGLTHRFETAHEAITAVGSAGYDLPKISATEGENRILWDAKEQCFAYYRAETDALEYVPDSKGGAAATPKAQLWAIYSEFPAQQEYSVYWAGGDLDKAEVTDIGFDAGSADVAAVVYTGTAEGKEIVIRTNGGTLSVEGANDCVSHYGHVDQVTVTAVAYHSYHEYGTVGRIEAVKGHVVLEDGCEVESLFVAAAHADKAAEAGVKLTLASDCDVKVVSDTPAQLPTVIANILGVESSSPAVDKMLPSILVTGTDGSVRSFEDIAEALARTNDNDTVTLLKDVVYRGVNINSIFYNNGLNEFEEYGAYGVKGDNVTIDLNGNTLTLKYQEGGKSAYGATLLSLNRYETSATKRLGFQNTTYLAANSNAIGNQHGPLYYLNEITDTDGSKLYVLNDGFSSWSAELMALYGIDSSSIEGPLSFIIKLSAFSMITNSYSFDENGEGYRAKYLNALGYDDVDKFIAAVREKIEEKQKSLLDKEGVSDVKDLSYEAQVALEVYGAVQVMDDMITDTVRDMFIGDWTSENNLAQLAEEFMRILNEEDDGYEYKEYGVSKSGEFQITLKKTETLKLLPSQITVQNGTIVNELFAHKTTGITTYPGTLRFQYSENSKLTFEGVTFKLGGNSAEGYGERYVMSLMNGDVANAPLVLTNCTFDENVQISINYNDLDTTGSSGNTYGSTSFDTITPDLYKALYKYVAGGSDGTRRPAD